jgi:hypothetical protein
MVALILKMTERNDPAGWKEIGVAADLNAVSRHTIMEALDQVRVSTALFKRADQRYCPAYGLSQGKHGAGRNSRKLSCMLGIDIMDKAPVGIEINGSHLTRRQRQRARKKSWQICVPDRA